MHSSILRFSYSALEELYSFADNWKAMRKNRYCPLFGRCGGCEYVNEQYEDEILDKYLKERKILSHFGEVYPVIEAKHTMGYRTKIQAVCGYDRDGKFTTGIYRRGTHKLIPVRSCILEDGRATAILQTVRQLANRFGITAYDEDEQKGDLRHILIRLGYNTREILVVLVAGRKDFPHKTDFVAALHQKHPDIVTITEVINTEKTSMVIPENPEVSVLYGKGYIIDKLCGLDFRISSTSFYQVNPEMTEVLYRVAMNMAQLKEDDVVIDAYCGTGTIGLIAASYGISKLIGIEANGNAVADAKLNAVNNGIENAEFITADAAKYLKSAVKEGLRASVLFMDPPRAGSSEEFLAAAGKTDADVIVYISCNPETLGRDLRYITRFLPYTVRGIQPVDLFPGGEFVETVVLLYHK